jgi:hypothetical protein
MVYYSRKSVVSDSYLFLDIFIYSRYIPPPRLPSIYAQAKFLSVRGP